MLCDAVCRVGLVERRVSRAADASEDEEMGKERAMNFDCLELIGADIVHVLDTGVWVLVLEVDEDDSFSSLFA